MKTLSATLLLSAVLIAPQIAPAARQVGCPVEESRRGRAEGPAEDGHRASFSRSSTARWPKRTTPWPSRPSAARSPWKAPSRATSRKRKSSAWTPRSPRPPPRCSPCWRSSRPTGTGSTSSTTAGGSCSARPRADRAGQGFYHLGPAAALRRDRQAFPKGPGRRGATQEDPRADLRRTAGQRHHARQLPAHALRLRGPPGPGVLQLGRAGGGQGGRRLRAFGRQPHLPADRGVRRLESLTPCPSRRRRAETDRQRFDHAQGHPALPAIAPLPSKRRGQIGPAGCRHRAAELRQQQGRGRGEGQRSTRWPCSVS